MSVFVVAADDLLFVVAVVAAHARGKNGPVVVRPGRRLQFMTRRVRARGVRADHRVRRDALERGHRQLTRRGQRRLSVSGIVRD